MFSSIRSLARGSSARVRPKTVGKASILALSVLLTVGGSSRGQTTATIGGTQAAADTKAPGEAAPLAAVGAQDVFGPVKPSANAAIRAALTRAGAQAMPADQRALLRAVDAFYAARGDAPIYFSGGAWTPQAHGVFERLQRAPEDGLDLRAWRIYSLDSAPEAALATGEIALAQAVAAFAFQASGGRIEPDRISKLIGLRPAIVPAAKALEETSRAADANAQLASYNPPQPQYRALREKLASLRENPGVGLLAEIPREQTSRKRRVSDARPMSALPSRATQESDLLANMEFWRWEPRDIAGDRIMVNIPEFVARLYRGEQVVATHRIIVGKPDKQTPLFSDKMEYIVVNPSWYVPQSIIKNEWGGRAQPGFDVVYQDGQVFMRQPPGERNALGRIKFIFPNRYAVYMHDTPTRHLFSQAKRAFSHGCMRVDQPASWAVAILGPQNGWSEQKIEKMYGKSERRVNLPAPLPIHIGYFTDTVDEFGQLHTFGDIYGYAAEVKRRLGLSI